VKCGTAVMGEDVGKGYLLSAVGGLFESQRAESLMTWAIFFEPFVSQSRRQQSACMSGPSDSGGSRHVETGAFGGFLRGTFRTLAYICPTSVISTFGILATGTGGAVASAYFDCDTPRFCSPPISYARMAALLSARGDRLTPMYCERWNPSAAFLVGVGYLALRLFLLCPW